MTISTGNQVRAMRTRQSIDFENIIFVYHRNVSDTARCGLRISSARKDSEMPLFSEPGLFLIGWSQKLEAAWISRFAFPLPPFDDILELISFIHQAEPSMAPGGSA